MSVVTSRAFNVPPIPWRVVGVVALLLLALAVGLAFVAGSQRLVPAPFGPAANGVVAYEKGGDIYTVDPVTGVSTAVITGPAADINPRWSRDGTRLAFERKVDGDSGPGVLYVARADGSHMVQLKTAGPIAQIGNYDFSPDGKELLINDRSGDYPRFLIAASDGSGVRTLDVARPAEYAAWRPPDGSEILTMDVDDGSNGCCGIHAINAETGSTRDILAIKPGRLRGYPRWSPDGSLISFAEWEPVADKLTVQTHIIAADGSGERILPSPPGTQWQAVESWSNDGTRLLVIRGYAPDVAGARPVAIPVDGSGTGVEIELPGSVNPADPVAWEWAPDDSLILGARGEDGAHTDQVLLDPVAGTSRTLPWSSISLPSWQRNAP